MKYLLPLSFWLLLAAPAYSEPVIPQNSFGLETISVSGLGKATLAPDRAIFTVGVQSTASNVKVAVKENNTKAAAIIAALKQAGATDDEIRTANFSINPQQEYKDGQPPRVVGYQVSNDITVTRDQIDDAGTLLQAAIDAGANQSSGLNLTVADETRGRDAALQAAFQDARAKATVLAQAAQRTLGRAISITEGGPPPFQPPQPVMARMEFMDKTSAAPPIEAGTQEVSFSVAVVFQLQ